MYPAGFEDNGQMYVNTAYGDYPHFLPDTKVGIRGTWRSLDQYSNRYSPLATGDDFSSEPIISPVGFHGGNEWEIRTYIHINIGK